MNCGRKAIGKAYPGLRRCAWVLSDLSGDAESSLVVHAARNGPDVRRALPQGGIRDRGYCVRNHAQGPGGDKAVSPAFGLLLDGWVPGGRGIGPEDGRRRREFATGPLGVLGTSGVLQATGDKRSNGGLRLGR